MKASTLLKFTFIVSSYVFAQVCNQDLTTNCITFLIGPGTGCDWMCNYCGSQLNSSSYYFLPPVCTYESGVGCVGNPQTGVSYSCCPTS
jgi:hypothetical protein